MKLSIIDDYSVSAIHVFQIRTLRSLGFSTRVALSNKSGSKKEFETDYQINLTVYSGDGKNIKEYKNIAFLPVSKIVEIDCSPWSDDGVDQVIIFHLVPIEYIEDSIIKKNQVSISRLKVWSLFTAQDHYVEYYKPDGFSSGVLYQSGAFNYKKFSTEETTIIQAPKIMVSSNVDTLLSLLHSSLESGYNRDAILQCSLLSPKGGGVSSWTEVVEPGTCKLISMRSCLSQKISLIDGDLKYFTLVAICKNAALLPLIFVTNNAHDTLAVEHSLPPLYYGQNTTGKVRANVIRQLDESKFFRVLK